MGKRASQYLLAALLTLGMVSLAQAASTKFTDVQCRNLSVTGTLTSGGCTCTNISTTTLNAADLNATYGVTGATVTATGLGTFARVTASSFTFTGASSVSVAPARTRELVIDSSYNVYVSTCTNVAGCWVKVGGQ